MSDTTSRTVTLSPRVVERLNNIHAYIRSMEAERSGYGDEPMRDVTATRESLLTVYNYILEAEEVWIDGGTGFSFGGVINGNIFGRFTFGMIARTGTPFKFTPEPAGISESDWRVGAMRFGSQESAQEYFDAAPSPFQYGPIEWTFHS